MERPKAVKMIDPKGLVPDLSLAALSLVLTARKLESVAKRGTHS